VNSFQLTTVWVLGIAAGLGCVYLLMWLRGLPRRWPRVSSPRPYRIDSPFVEIWVEDGCSLSELRALFESIRDDPGLPSEALLLFDGRTRKERLPEADVRARLAVFLDTLRPRMAPAYAVVVSAAIASAAEAAQREAEVAGLRVGLLQDFDRARRWLSGYAPASSHS
jgi:hypothetical protein